MRSVTCVRRVDQRGRAFLVLDGRAGRVFVDVVDAADLARALLEVLAGAKHATCGDGCRCSPELLEQPELVDGVEVRPKRRRRAQRPR